MMGRDRVEVKTESFENHRWGMVCCCCAQRIPKGALMDVEIREDSSQRAEPEWHYTRHHIRCPSSTRPHGFNVDLAHAIIKLTDNFGTFQLDNVISSTSGRRASTLTLSEILQTCAESLQLLAGPYVSNHIGISSHPRIATAAADPVSFLDDVAAEARGSRSMGWRSSEGEQLRIKRAVCKATIDTLFLCPPAAADQLLTTSLGSLVVLPSLAGATTEEAVPTSRRHSFPRSVLSDGTVASALHSSVPASPAAMSLLDTCPPQVRGSFLAGVDEESCATSWTRRW
eukprot:g19210.t1